MFKSAKSRLRDRKLRLFSVACCRHIEHTLTDPRCRAAIDVAEAYADGFATPKQLEAARLAAHHAACESFERLGKHGHSPEWAAEYVAEARPFHSAESVSWMSATASERTKQSLAEAYAFQTDVVRDLLPNPFLPLPAIDQFIPRHVVKLATEIYSDMAFACLPELAVNLEYANCNLPHLIAHFKSPAVHVPGCWALDLLLGKT